MLALYKCIDVGHCGNIRREAGLFECLLDFAHNSLQMHPRAEEWINKLPLDSTILHEARDLAIIQLGGSSDDSLKFTKHEEALDGSFLLNSNGTLKIVSLPYSPTPIWIKWPMETANMYTTPYNGRPLQPNYFHWFGPLDQAHVFVHGAYMVQRFARCLL